MSDRYNRLKSLMSLAQEPSSDKRRELLREITDLFVEDPCSYSTAEADHMGGIMGQIAFKMEMEVRKHLADRMADLSEAPKNLIVQLANDDISVAQPVLEKSGVLDSEELLEIIQSQSQEHLMAISTRETVSAEVADGLVERGNDDVLVTLVKNKGAELSEQSQAKIVTRAQDNEALHAPLADRTDLSADCMENVFTMVSDALKDHILANTEDMDESVVDRLIQQARSSVSRNAQDEEEAIRSSEAFIEDRMKMGGLDEKFLMRLLGKGQVDEFVAGLARMSKISTRTARRIVFETDGEALAVACKANSFSKATFTNVLAMSRREAKIRHGVEDDGTKQELLDLYDQIPLQSAKRAIRFWNTREQAKQYQTKRIN